MEAQELTINGESLEEIQKGEKLAKAKKLKKPVDPKSLKKWKIWGITTLVVGVITLIAGVGFLVFRMIEAGRQADGEYLVAAGNWTLSGEDGVVWDFTEIGKGTLTTNNHINDYNFEWAIDGDKLIIETDWLYDMEDEYEYSLDQGNGVLTLTDGDGTYEFVTK